MTVECVITLKLPDMKERKRGSQTVHMNTTRWKMALPLIGDRFAASVVLCYYLGARTNSASFFPYY